ncbi:MULTISPECIES: BON domain-containing protein [unclassified Polaromonas]|uniref:BON domain-containing protein n=1 Tax=unclassified Polaromonas TaxID=2638319 RepID=UPI0018CB12C3|nr:MULTISPECIES: BON domain-containing protein [unclassified Polaromonas]MBG6072318.1 osmotically-inducible protein OsmY [Polaromonas sp. CG_9.7]MDH6182791.1 osmotically-inducible protein OsmY [Polaromonas sp. CG_23.6]
MNYGAMKRMAGMACTAVVLSSLLSACVGPLLVGGAMVGGTLLAVDRRTSGAQLDDEAIELRAANQIRSNLGTRVRASVTSYNRQVLLTGEVPNLQDKQRVEEVVKSVESVASVVNELAVLNSPSLMDRSADTLLTGRIKAMLLDARELQSNAFKIVTERNTVYLMGRVTQREADRATEVVRGTPGVQKVVRLLEIISEQELQRIGTVPAKNAQPAASVKL